MDKAQRYRQDMPAFYRIQVYGQITKHWAIWFEELAISVERLNDLEVITTIAGELVDQAALMGVLQKLYSLGLSLIAVKREETERAC